MNEVCEECGSKVSGFRNGCPGCGAPCCCTRCCDEANSQLSEERFNSRSHSLTDLLKEQRRYQAIFGDDSGSKSLKKRIHGNLDVIVGILEQAASNSFSWDHFQNMGDIARINDRDTLNAISEMKNAILWMLGEIDVA